VSNQNAGGQLQSRKKYVVFTIFSLFPLFPYFFSLQPVFHQLSLFHYADEFYKRVLMEALPSDESQQSLKREAAYMLSHIYTQSGSPELAAMVINRWIK
jgi:hypothetical protein